MENEKNLKAVKIDDHYPDAKSWLELLGIVIFATTSICIVSVAIISYFVGIDIFV